MTSRVTATAPDSPQDSQVACAMPKRLRTVVAVTAATGAVIIVHSAHVARGVPISPALVILGLVTMASGRFAIQVPGRAATVSVSEVFLFSIVRLYGPAAATLVVAIDGMWVSLVQRDRRLYRAVFNVAEPAISIWTAGQLFFAIDRRLDPPIGTGATVIAGIAMAAVFFVLNSGLTALAIGIESSVPPFDVWRRHAAYLAANYYAAASLAVLAVGPAGGINVVMVSLVVPLLILSYVAYREAATRVGDAQRHVTEIRHLHLATTEMLAMAVDAKDQVTHGHIRRVQRRTLAVARALGVGDPRELQAVESGALLHDIGKLAIPDYLLNKPSGLSASEFDIVKTHAVLGARILMSVDFPYPIVPIVRHHHEQWNGRGYPDGLVGVEIPIGARIIAVVDCFDALTSDRPYRSRLTCDEAVAILQERAGIFYDPAVVEAFVALLPELQRNDAAESSPTPRPPVVSGFPRAVVAAGQAAGAPPAVPRRVRAHIDESAASLHVEACLYGITADRLVVAHATPGIRGVLKPVCLGVGAGVSGWVTANRSTIRDAEAALDLGDLANAIGLERCISTPVFVAGDVLGALTAYHPAGPRPDSAVRALCVLAQEVGIAIASACDPDEQLTAMLASETESSRTAVAR